jgi:hypothetical protein
MSSNPSNLQEGIDFYIENGLFVLSEKYLKERGYCCGNKCRHCPYDWENVPRFEQQTKKTKT